jgi:CBS domain-containing protein
MKIDSMYLSKSIGLLNPPPAKLVLKDTSLVDVINILKEDSSGAVLICEPNDKLIGIFTERDVVKKIITQNIDLNSKISEFMTINPMSVKMTTPLAFALQLMSEGGFRHVPIVDEDDIALSIITTKDFVNEIVKNFILNK